MPDPPTSYIKFFAGVDARSINSLMSVVDQKLKAGVTRFVILISSPGGTVFHGLSAYNYLRGLPAEVFTHNFGSVDSIAAVVFCAGSRRYSVPDARFLLHPVGLTVEAKTRFDELSLQETIRSIQSDMENIAGAIAQATGKEEAQIKQAMLERTALSSEKAKEFGLVHEIKKELLPAGSDLVSITEP